MWGIVCKTTSFCKNSSTTFAVAQIVCSGIMVLRNFDSKSQTRALSEHMFNDEPGWKNDVMSFFQTYLDSVYRIIMVVFVFGGMEENGCSELAFDNIVLADHGVGCQWVHAITSSFSNWRMLNSGCFISFVGSAYKILYLKWKVRMT